MNNKQKYTALDTDVLIAGCGQAGLSAAYEVLKQNKKVILVSKNDECASNYVLGFNAPVNENDSVELYENDTLQGGLNIGNKNLARALSEGSLEAVELLEKQGFIFDKDNGEYNLLKPLGCSCARLVHIENHTGRTTVSKYWDFVNQMGAQVLSNSMIVDLLVKDKKIIGAKVINKQTGEIYIVKCKSVILATGGIHIAKDSTYPKFMTGDGYALAYKAGARLVDMEFIQFEPCRCIYPKKLGISTTLLAKGGQIKNNKGERFLLKHYQNEGLVSKDMLARLIALEVQNGNGSQHSGVYLDLTLLDPKEIIENHSLYYQRFIKEGIDLTKDIIEVGPAAHSFMGGIVIDEQCRTDIEGLFAAGEVAGGIHGANRVGGNAGSEIYVFGKIAGNSAAKYCQQCSQAFSVECNYADTVFEKGNTTHQDYNETKENILEIMHKYMGPARSEDGMLSAQQLLKDILKQIQDSKPTDTNALISKYEVENLALVCTLSVKAAIKRKESRGVHYRTDYPEVDKAFCNSLCVSVYDED
ncbi:MAG: FAD-binding protein [Clostridiales bacterium]|nr:FAD-binding protein [Clostridiales bacterium]